MKNRKIIGLVALLVGVVLAGGLLTFNIVQTTKTVNVYQTTTSIAAGAQIEETNVEKLRIQKSDVQSSYITDLSQIVGKYATVDIVSGDIITSSKISSEAASTDNQYLSIPSGKQAISFSVAGGADSLSNKLQVGDIIRIYSYDSSTNTVQSPDSLKYVRVASITSSAYQDVAGNTNNGTSSGSDAEDNAYSTITVVVYTQQVNDLIKIQNNSGPYITLISRGNDELAEQLLQEQERLLEEG